MRCRQLAMLIFLPLVAGVCSAQESGGQPADAPQRLAQLRAQIDAHSRESRIAEAIDLAGQHLNLARALYGDADYGYCGALELLAGLEEADGRFVEARQRRAEVVSLLIDLLGQEDWRVTDARWALKSSERIAGLPANARRELIQAIRDEARGVELARAGNLADALELLKAVAAVRKRHLGAEHPQYAHALAELGRLYTKLGTRDLAETHLLEALEIRRERLGPAHPRFADSLFDLGDYYDLTGRYRDAEAAYRESQSLMLAAYGSEHPVYAAFSSLFRNNLALVLLKLGDTDSAIQLLSDSLEPNRQGEVQENAWNALGRLASVYQHTGDYVKAEELSRRAVEAARRRFGEQSVEFAQTLNNLGALYVDLLDAVRAEPLLQRAMAIFESHFGQDHPRLGTVLSNLGLMYQYSGEFQRAEPFLERAAEIARRHAGPESAGYAEALDDLGFLYQYLGEFARAERAHLRASEILQSAYGRDHPLSMRCVNNLSVLSSVLGNHERAKKLGTDVLEFRRQLLGPEHPSLGPALFNLATVYRYADQPGEAEPLLHAALELNEMQFDDFFAVQGERQRIGFLATTRYALDGYLSLARSIDIPAPKLYDHVLRWKGAVAGRLAEEWIARDKPQLRTTIDELMQVRRRLATLARNVPNPAQRDAWRRQLDQLQQNKEALQAQLSRESSEFRQQTPLGLDAVQAAIPDQGLFIDFLEYVWQKCPDDRRGALQRQRRLAAFLVDRRNAPILVDLGELEPLEQAVTTWRTQLNGAPVQALRRTAEEIADRVWRPLAAHAAGKRVILVAPDGVINRFPLAALPGSRPGTYLIEETVIGYVASARQLVDTLRINRRQPASRPNVSGLLMVGGVDYNAVGPPAEIQVASRNDRPVHAPLLARRSGQGYATLPGMKAEADQIVELFSVSFPAKPVQYLTGAEATERRVQHELARRWRYAHFATHGFFAAPEFTSALRPEVANRSESAVGEPAGLADRAFGLNPMLLSGVVLAGANHVADSTDSDAEFEDGILTAEEIAGSDLRSIDVAVLSACETGMGTLAAGEGVLGLQRAFETSGARGVVASLWKVDDAATQQLMTDFYAYLWQQGHTPLEALYRAQLAMLNRTADSATSRAPGAVVSSPVRKTSQRAHPKLWAAWVFSGSPPETLSASIRPILPPDPTPPGSEPASDKPSRGAAFVYVWVAILCVMVAFSLVAGTVWHHVRRRH